MGDIEWCVTGDIVVDVCELVPGGGIRVGSDLVVWTVDEGGVMEDWVITNWQWKKFRWLVEIRIMWRCVKKVYGALRPKVKRIMPGDTLKVEYSFKFEDARGKE